MKRFPLLIMAMVALAGPAMGQAPAPVESATVAASRNDWMAKAKAKKDEAQKRASEIQLIFDGDSITEGWGGRFAKEPYAKLGVANFAISGDRTQNVLWRLNNGQVDGLKPRVIFLMIGTNNIKDQPQDIAAGVGAVVAEYRKRCPDAVIVLQAIFPRAPKADDPARAKLKAVNTEIAKLGDGDKVIYMDFGDKFLNADGSMSPDVMPDFLHPAEKGYVIWADAIRPVIDKYFPPTPSN